MTASWIHRAALLGWLALACLQGAPPVEYVRLEIVYRVASDARVTETRRGEIRLNGTPALRAVSGVLTPKMNAEGRVTMRELTIVRSGGAREPVTAGTPEQSERFLLWRVPGANAGDSIRFETEQSVDVAGEAGAWWFTDPGLVPAQVGRAVVEVHAGNAAVSVLDTKGYRLSGTTHAWELSDLQPGKTAPLYTIASFQSARETAAWMARTCPVPAAAQVKKLFGITDTTPAAIAHTFSMRMRVAEGLRPRRCRPPAELLAASDASLFEAQAILAGALSGAERAVSFHHRGTPLPDNFTRAWVRVKVGHDWLWFDVSGMDASSPEPRVERVLSLDTGEWIDLAASPQPGRVAAKLEAVVLPTGRLHATLRIEAAGRPGQQYRDAFQSRTGRTDVQKLFGPFLQARQLRSPPIVSDPYDRSRLFEVTLPILEEQFILPIERQPSMELNALPLAADPQPLDGGRTWIGHPGEYVEEIVASASNYRLSAAEPVDVDKGFARFRSSSRVDDGKLHITRELIVRTSVVAADRKSDLDELWRTIRTDQARRFSMRRIDDSGVKAWIETVPPYQANNHALKALQQREYEVARQLLERVVKWNPRDEYAWNNLGRALGGLGKLAEARTAYERQIELNPRDKYAYNNLGLLDIREGRWSAARDRFRKQLEINPGDPFATRNLPRTLDALGEWDEAVAAWTKAAEANPNVPQYRMALAGPSICAGKPSAVESAAEVIARVPNPLLKNDIAYTLAQCGKELELAERYALEAVEFAEKTRPRNPRLLTQAFAAQRVPAMLLDTLGWVNWKRGDTQNALRRLTDVAALIPAAEPLAHLAEVQGALGQVDEAVSNWRSAVQLMPGIASRIPPELAERVAAATPRNPHAPWILTQTLKGLPPLDGVLFAAAFMDSGGALRNIKPIGAATSIAREIEDGLRGMTTPVVNGLREPLSVVYVLKLERNKDGGVDVFRSTHDDAIRIIAELAPEEFPLAFSPPQ
jgi:tetratricopeptide (TPR) repeat protein